MPRLLASFDVFDTLLTRPTGSPGSALQWFARHLASRRMLPCSAHAFARLRIAAEHRCFANAGGLDSQVSLVRIYQDVALAIDIDPEQLAREELAFEQRILEPVPAGVARLRAARERGHDIAFLSDMYLGRANIEPLLVRHGLFQPGDILLVSADHAASKREGTLFRKLQRDTSLAAHQIEHHGNDAHSDVLAARRAGLRVHPFDEGNPNPLEQLLDGYSTATDGMAASLAGASRLTRLSMATQDEHERALTDIAAGVAAPLLIGFLLWVLKNAQRSGVSRLYFIARDGQVLIQMAQVLVDRLGLKIELRYLYGSRLAWVFPAAGKVTGPVLDALVPVDGSDGRQQYTLTQFFSRFGIARDVAQPALSQTPFADRGWDDDLQQHEVVALRTLALQPGPVNALLDAQALATRVDVLDYLRQEGFGDHEKTGIVDLGTGATLYRALARLLDSASLPLPAGYYFGQRRIDFAADDVRPQTYLYDANEQIGFCEHFGLIGFLEAVCSADHGSVCGYRRHDRRLEPVLASPDNPMVKQWGHDTVTRALETVCLKAVLDPDLVDWRSDLRAAGMAAFLAFWRAPTLRDARAWGAFPLDDGWGSESRWLRLAEPYPLGALLRSGYPHRHWWHEGAAAISPPWIRAGLQARQQALRVIKKLRAIVRTGAGQVSNDPGAIEPLPALIPADKGLRSATRTSNTPASDPVVARRRTRA